MTSFERMSGPMPLRSVAMSDRAPRSGITLGQCASIFIRVDGNDYHAHRTVCMIVPSGREPGRGALIATVVSALLPSRD
jgi:hypothetical protein